ncbi:unnamed protein product [Clonostachys rosea]|uniref:Uncharacterized protein n=1 Tax=Bionectria ochroleuca TaxID=29856 RepID=A0ABY6UYT8_BIOOC|nr:unnamed protein product [Clonostachys rosea]
MKFSTVLAWASLALATPTPAVQSSQEEKVCKIYNNVFKLEELVFNSKAKIVATVEAFERDPSQNPDDTIAAIDKELEAINVAILKAVGSTRNAIAVSWPILPWNEKPEVFSCFLQTCSSTASCSVDLQSITSTVTNLSLAIRKPLAESIGILTFLCTPAMESILGYCNKLVEQCPI